MIISSGDGPHAPIENNAQAGAGIYFWDPSAARVRACEEALASMAIERKGLMDDLGEAESRLAKAKDDHEADRVSWRGAHSQLERTLTAAQGTIGMLEAERNAAHVLAEQRLTESREAAEELGRGARELQASTAELMAGRVTMQDQRNHINHLEARIALMGYTRSAIGGLVALALVSLAVFLGWLASGPMPAVDYTGPPDMTHGDYWAREFLAGQPTSSAKATPTLGDYEAPMRTTLPPPHGTWVDPNPDRTPQDRTTGSGELHRPMPYAEEGRTSAGQLRVSDGNDNPGAILRHPGPWTKAGCGACPEDVWECITHKGATIHTCVGCGIAHGANSYRILLQQVRNPPSWSAWVVRPEEPEANPNMARKVDTSR